MYIQIYICTYMEIYVHTSIHTCVHFVCPKLEKKFKLHYETKKHRSHNITTKGRNKYVNNLHKSQNPG